MVVPFTYILLALLSLALSILCFGNLLVSCSGHPPITTIGIWIMPLSLLGGAVFLYLSLFFLRAPGHREPGQLRKEARRLPKKVIVFLISFSIAATIYFVLMFIALVFELTAAAPEWVGYILYVLFGFMAVYAAVVVYRRLLKFGS